MTLDVIIVAYECREALMRCLDGLDHAAGACRVIVVDNDSSDGTAELLLQREPAIELVALEENIGFGAAVNRGVAAGNADSVLLLNPDAVIDSVALGRLRSALAADPQLAAAGPRIRDDSGRLELSSGRTMSPINEAGFKLVETLRRIGLVERWLESRHDEDRETVALSGACMLLRRDAFEAVGGFDERFFLYGEDVDLCRRLTVANWRLSYVAGATVLHTRGASAAARPLASEIAYRRSQLAFYRKHHRPWIAGLLSQYVKTRYRLRIALRAGPGASRAREVLAALEREQGAA